MADEKKSKAEKKVTTSTQTVIECVYVKGDKFFACSEVLKTYEVNEDGSKRLVKSEVTKVLFKLEIVREKSNLSHKERLVIVVKDDDEKIVAENITNPAELEKNLIDLSSCGVVLPRNVYGTLAKLIVNNYLDLACTSKAFDEDATVEKITQVFNMYCDYILSSGKKPTEVKGSQLYLMTVSDFDKCLADSDYSRLDLTGVKKAFKEKNFIKTNANRHDYNFGNEKYIAFYAEEVDKHKEAE